MSLTQLHDSVNFYRCVWGQARERGDEETAAQAWEVLEHFRRRLVDAEYGRAPHVGATLLDSESDPYGLRRAAWAGEDMSTGKAASRLGVSARRIRQLITQGRLPARKIGRDWLVRRGDVDGLATRSRSRGRPRAAAQTNAAGAGQSLSNEGVTLETKEDRS